MNARRWLRIMDPWVRRMRARRAGPRSGAAKRTAVAKASRRMRALGRVAILIWLALVSTAVYALDCDSQATRISPVLYGPSPELDRRAQATIGELLMRMRERSRSLGAAQLLARAERIGTDAVSAQGLPRLTLSASATRLGRNWQGQPERVLNESTIAVDLGAPIYDGGRISALTDAQRQQAEAARLDAVALEHELERLTVAAALERSRYYKHEQVFGQHVSRMQCLADAIDMIVQADPGRASERVQALKSIQQLALARERSRAAKAEVELRLRHLVGSALPELEGLTTLLREAPAQALVEGQVDQGASVMVLRSRLQSEQARTRALRAERRPHLDWRLRHTHSDGEPDGNEWRASIQLNLPVLDFTHRPQIDAGVLREQALQARIDDALAERLSDLAQTRERARASFARMEDVDAILENSDLLRRFTLEQWRTMGRRSLFDVMSAEQDHYGLRISQIDALHDGQQSVARLWSLGPGLSGWLEALEPAKAVPNPQGNGQR
ncbi:MAG: TolC family protein [Burkholderiaceae bacterium]